MSQFGVLGWLLREVWMGTGIGRVDRIVETSHSPSVTID